MLELWRGVVRAYPANCSTRPANVGFFSSSWLAALRFTSDVKNPTLAGPTISIEPEGGMFLTGSKAERSEPCR